MTNSAYIVYPVDTKSMKSDKKIYVI